MLFFGKKKLNLGASCVLESYALWSFACEIDKFPWAVEVIRTLTDVGRQIRQRDYESYMGNQLPLSKVSWKARVPFKGAIPGPPRGGGQPFSPLALHQQEILHPETCSLAWSVPLRCGFTRNMWVKDTSNKWQPPQTRSGHHLERKASLGISQSSCRVTFACLSYSSFQKQSLSFSRHSEN